MGLVDNDLVELDGGVHPPDVGVVPGNKENRTQFFDILRTIREDPALPHVTVLFPLTA